MIGLILTCAVSPRTNISFLKQTDPYQRLDWYIKSIRKWMSDPDVISNKIPIVVVDNSDWAFTKLRQLIKDESLENQVEILSYLESSTDSQEKGYYECLSIQWAIKHSVLLEKCDFVIKITGRYHVPNLIPTVKSILLASKRKVDCIRQNKGFRCEIVGFRKELYLYLFDPFGINPKYILERALSDRTSSLHSVQLPPMEIEPTRNGGFDTIVTSL